MNTVTIAINLGRTLEMRGEAAEAERLLRKAETKLDPANAGQRQPYVNARTGVGLALLAQGRAAEGRELLASALELARRELGEDHLRTADARLALGRALLVLRRYAEAEPMLRAAADYFGRQRKTQPYFAEQAAAALAELRRRQATGGSSSPRS